MFFVLLRLIIQVSTDNDLIKPPLKQCRQIGSTTLSTEAGIGPGRPDLQSERQNRQTKQDACSNSKNSKPSATTNGVSTKKTEKKVQPPVISGSKNTNKSSAWK